MADRAAHFDFAFDQQAGRTWTTQSRYVAAADGTRLAVDIHLPQSASAPLPCVLLQARYMRAWIDQHGRRHDAMTSYSDAAVWRHLSRSGYAIVVADLRGGGASFGHDTGAFSVEEGRDVAGLIDWIAAQPWSTGAVGMAGRSYVGLIQYVAAANRPTALKAIFPQLNGFDAFDLFFPGGVPCPVTPSIWPLATLADHGRDPQGRHPAPVDDDPEGLLRDEAIEEHLRGPHVTSEFFEMLGAVEHPFRDEIAGGYFVQAAATGMLSGATIADRVRQSRIPVYQFGGWLDGFARDAVSWYLNLDGPKRLIMGPWAHVASEPDKVPRDRALIETAANESRRWFDRWLKGVPNGIDEDPPVRLAIADGSGDWAWHDFEDWPSLAQVPVGLVNDGERRLEVGARGAAGAAQDSFSQDLTATSGPANKIAHVNGAGPLRYERLEENDARGCAFTSRPLLSALTVVGTPVLELWVASSAPDADLVVHLSEVDDAGRLLFVCDGVLRASCRSECAPPYRYDGPWHPCGREALDVAPLTAGWVRLRIALTPIGWRFRPGVRMRLTLHAWDDALYRARRLPEGARIHLSMSPDRPSYLSLPTIEANDGA